jgi:hypothetical protein
MNKIAFPTILGSVAGVGAYYVFGASKKSAIILGIAAFAFGLLVEIKAKDTILP